jgi:hypothetical protein
MYGMYGMCCQNSSLLPARLYTIGIDAHCMLSPLLLLRMSCRREWKMQDANQDKLQNTKTHR